MNGERRKGRPERERERGKGNKKRRGGRERGKLFGIEGDEEHRKEEKGGREQDEENWCRTKEGE